MKRTASSRLSRNANAPGAAVEATGPRHTYPLPTRQEQCDFNVRHLEDLAAGFIQEAEGHAAGGPVGFSHNVTTVNFYGPADREYVRNTIMPEIAKAVRRGR